MRQETQLKCGICRSCIEGVRYRVGSKRPETQLLSLQQGFSSGEVKEEWCSELLCKRKKQPTPHFEER